MHSNGKPVGDGELARAFDFLKEVGAREADARASKWRPMSVEGHRKMRQMLGDVLFLKLRYAHQTEVNVSGSFKKWNGFVFTALPSLACPLRF